MTAELWRLSAIELAAGIRDRDFTSAEVVAAHLARIEQVDPQLNAAVRVLADEAIAAAAAADLAVREGAPLGPLHGVPCTVKENIDLAGTPTTQGVPALAEAIAEHDAPVVARMRAAGAIPIARTNLPDLGLRIHTDSTLHGLTRNPWDPRVTAGGSSGGEGAAIASGMSPLGLGNDIGGSLRNPAHCCGIASIKPSAGVVPRATEIPPVDPTLASQLMLVEGVMARRVADVRVGFEAVIGPHPRDPSCLPAGLVDLAPGERLRIAVLADPPGGRTDPGIAAAVRRAADALADLGHEVVEATPPSYEEVVRMWGELLMGDLRVIAPLLDAVMGESGRAVLANFRAEIPEPTAVEALELHSRRFRAMREWSTFFAEYPILVSPTWALPAFEHDADVTGSADGTITELLRPVLPANLLGLPTAVVPAGLAGDLPVGVQISGDRFTDLRCLSIAEQIDDAFAPLTPIDPFPTRVTHEGVA